LLLGLWSFPYREVAPVERLIEVSFSQITFRYYGGMKEGHWRCSSQQAIVFVSYAEGVVTVRL